MSFKLVDFALSPPATPLKLSPYKRTGFFITANTNRTATLENYLALKGALEAVVSGTSTGLAPLVQRNKGEGLLQVADSTSPLKYTLAVEGTSKGRLHAHAMMAFKYPREVAGEEQRLWIPIEELKALIREEYKTRGGVGGVPYINCRVQGLSTDAAYIYIHKEGEVTTLPPTAENLKLWVAQNTHKRWKPSDSELSPAAAAKAAKRKLRK